MKKLLLIACFLITTPLCASEIANIKVNHIYDGDTIFVDLDCDIDIVCKNVPVRIRHIDTPEIKGKSDCEKKLAIKSRDFVIDTIKNNTITLQNVEKEKYGRLLADVYVNNTNISDLLIKNKLAYKYEGEKKPDIDWCVF